MSLREHLSEVLARDPRYSIQAYAFIFEAIEYTKNLRRRSRVRSRGRASRATRKAGGGEEVGHVTGPELCEGARRLAIDHYGMMALTVLNLWGLRSTSDLGEVVYNLIASGDLVKTPTDSREDFDNVYDFEDAFLKRFSLSLDEVA